MRCTVPTAVATILLAGQALAEVPRVVTDTAPVHSLVARVMQGVGTPDLLLPPGGSPHDASLRPSDARRLSEAELIIWTGPDFLTWLEESLTALAPEAQRLALLETDGWTQLPLREDPAFETEGHDDHGEADEEAEHGSHDASGATDPHAWLDPEVAAAWSEAIAETLAAADLENAELYRDNAEAAIAADAEITARIAERLAPFADRPYLVAHDAYQYFETRFGLPAAGALALSDASAPGPARIAALREMVEAGGITCVLTDPETAPDLVALLRENSDAATAATDPDALGLEPGPDLYPALMEGLAAAYEDCLG